jgi:hypothetical protein
LLHIARPLAQLPSRLGVSYNRCPVAPGIDDQASDPGGRLDLTAIVCASPNEVSSRVGEEAAVLDLDAGLYYGLDPVGARIFELLQSPTRLGDVVSILVDEYEIDEDSAGRDLLAFVGDLYDRRLVVLADDS